MNILNFRASLLLLIAMFAMALRIDGIDICNDPSIDAIVQLPNGFTHVFKGSQVNKLFQNAGPIPTFGYFEPISDDFPGLPNNLDAAVVRGTSTYFLKGWWFWEVIFHVVVEVGSIHLEFPRVPDKLDAAFDHKNATVFLKESSYYKYLGETVLHGSIWDWGPWPLVHPDAAILYTNNLGNDFLYVFKGIWYYGIDPETKQVLPGFPQKTGPDWFGCE